MLKPRRTKGGQMDPECQRPEFCGNVADIKFRYEGNGQFFPDMDRLDDFGNSYSFADIGRNHWLVGLAGIQTPEKIKN